MEPSFGPRRQKGTGGHFIITLQQYGNYLKADPQNWIRNRHYYGDARSRNQAGSGDTKKLVLPSRAHFPQFVKLIEDSGAGQAKDCANVVRFQAFSGCRISEANRVTGRHIDADRDEIVVRGDPETGTKNWAIRRVPMIPELKELHASLRLERPDEPPML